MRNSIAAAALCLLLGGGVAQAQVQTLQKQLGTGQPTTVAVGGQVVYDGRGQ